MLDKLQTKVATALMKRFSVSLPIAPSPIGPGIFSHRTFVDAPAEEQRQVLLASAQYRYDHEIQLGFFDTYFPWLTPNELAGKTLLDLGCFTGGRLARWNERYKFGRVYGIDIAPVFGKAGRLFAESRGQRIFFATGIGEHLPYRDSQFDFIVATDVFEHVTDVSLVMAECFRTLKPGGRLLTAFPQFYQPLESHMGMATRLHALQWVFSPRALREAYAAAQSAHGPEAYWYRRPLDKWEQWEVLPSLNGITVRRFRRILTERSWTVRRWNRRPILSSGRRSKRPIFRLLRTGFLLPARLPLLEELFLDRICVDVQKTA